MVTALADENSRNTRAENWPKKRTIARVTSEKTPPACLQKFQLLAEHATNAGF